MQVASQAGAWIETGSFQSGQMGQTVNLLAQPSKVRILHSPIGRYIYYISPFFIYCEKSNTFDKRGEWRIRNGAFLSKRQGVSLAQQCGAWMRRECVGGPKARSRMRRAGGRILHSPIGRYIYYISPFFIYCEKSNTFDKREEWRIRNGAFLSKCQGVSLDQLPINTETRGTP